MIKAALVLLAVIVCVLFVYLTFAPSREAATAILLLTAVALTVVTVALMVTEHGD